MDIRWQQHTEQEMPRGPNGEKRPADVIANAVHVMRIATGEIAEVAKAKSGRTRSGQAGARARVRATTSKERSEIARRAAMARWSK